MWDIRYRPLNFRDVLGQEGTVKVLQAQLRGGTALDTSYIFEGGAGQGKTTLARILARALLCQNLDKNSPEPEPCNECDNCKDILNETSMAFVEKDAASNGTIDQIRAIVDGLPFAVLGAPKRIYLFDECFTEDTLLVTRQGSKSIRTLVKSRSTEDVLSYDTKSQTVVWRSLSDWFVLPDERDVVRLVFDNGVEITVTEDQEVLTRNRGWVKAVELTEDDDIVETSLGVPVPKGVGL